MSCNKRASICVINHQTTQSLWICNPPILHVNELQWPPGKLRALEGQCNHGIRNKHRLGKSHKGGHLLLTCTCFWIWPMEWITCTESSKREHPAAALTVIMDRGIFVELDVIPKFAHQIQAETPLRSFNYNF